MTANDLRIHAAVSTMMADVIDQLADIPAPGLWTTEDSTGPVRELNWRDVSILFSDRNGLVRAYRPSVSATESLAPNVPAIVAFVRRHVGAPR